MPKHFRASAGLGGKRRGATHRQSSEVRAVLGQLSNELLRAALEPTALSLEDNPPSGSPGSPLLLRVAAPRALNACDIELEVFRPWCIPFRLVRVAVRLPAEVVSLNSTDFDALVHCLTKNMKAEAMLEVPWHATNSSRTASVIACARPHHTVFDRQRRTSRPVSVAAAAAAAAPLPHLTKLLTAVRVSDSAINPRYGRCVLVEIPVPAGIILHPGVAISLNVSIAGASAFLRIPATGHIHGSTCNHKPGPVGDVWRAASVGNAAALEAALAAGGSTEEADADDNDITALETAASNGYAEAVRILLAAGADVQNDGWTPLHEAAENGDTLVVHALLGDARVNPEARDEEGSTPLALAASEGHTTIVQDLLGDPRVDPGGGDDEGCTALHSAAAFGHPLVVQALLKDPRVNPGATDEDGRSPLDLAVMDGHADVVQALLRDTRVDPRESDVDGWTLFHSAAKEGHTTVIQVLLEDPRVSPGERNSDGRSPLAVAAAEGHAAVVQALLGDPRVDPGEGDANGNTPLHLAAWRGNGHVVHALLGDPRVSLGEKNNQGKTPLDLATQGDYADVVTMITLEAGRRAAAP